MASIVLCPCLMTKSDLYNVSLVVRMKLAWYTALVHALLIGPDFADWA